MSTRVPGPVPGREGASPGTVGVPAECLTLRVKDVDLDRGEIRLRRGKGAKDRMTVLAESLREPLRAHLARGRELHDRDLVSGGGRVENWFRVDGPGDGLAIQAAPTYSVLD